MYTLKLMLLLAGINLSHSQPNQNDKYIDFIKYVGKNFNVSDSIKYDCNWHYLVVRINTNSKNKITRYECLNPVSNELKDDLKFLTRYQFSNKLKINGRPIVFYLSIDNSAICKHKPSDMVYDPNDVIGLMRTYLDKIEADNSRTIIIRDMIMKLYFAPQH